MQGVAVVVGGLAEGCGGMCGCATGPALSNAAHVSTHPRNMCVQNTPKGGGAGPPPLCRHSFTTNLNPGGSNAARQALCASVETTFDNATGRTALKTAIGPYCLNNC